LLKQNVDFCWGEAQEAAFLKVVISFTSGKTLRLRHYDLSQRASLETNAFDFAIASILSQKFEERKIHPIAFAFRKSKPAELNCDSYNKEMLAVVYCFQFWRHFLEEAELKLGYYPTTKI
jgi:hypothetical protein